MRRFTTADEAGADNKQEEICKGVQCNANIILPMIKKNNNNKAKIEHYDHYKLL